MAFTVTFPASGPPVAVSELAAWLTEQGEPFSLEGEDTLSLRALPLRFVSSPESASLKAQLDVTSTATIERMVDVLFVVSMRAGADVVLAGHGPVTRAALWMRLADEQDRLRIAEALQRAGETGSRDEIHKRLWAVLATLRQGHDDRWDANQERVVELVEVGDGISEDEALWHVQDARKGDVIPVPVVGTLHCLVWRWLSEAYPGIAEAEHTLH
jgi:hypothetical protein